MTRWWWVIPVLLLAVGWVAHAQDDAPETPPPASEEEPTEPEPAPEPEGPDPRFATPRTTVETFLAAADRLSESSGEERARALEEAASCFAVQALGSAEDAIDVARITQAASVLEWVDWEGAFDWFISSETGRGRVILYPIRDFDEQWELSLETGTENLRIVLVETSGGEWKFSEGTVEDLPILWTRLQRRLGGDGRELTWSMWLRSRIPLELQEWKFLSLEAWQWLGILLVLFVGFLLDLVVRSVLRGAWGRYQRKRRVETEKRVVVRAVRPFGLFFAAVFWFWTLGLLDLPPGALEVLRVAVRFFLMLASVLAGFRVIDLIAAFATAKAEETRTKFDDLLIPLGRKTLKIFLAVMGGIYIAQSFNIEILPLLTGLGIGGLAFAFAAKDTIENFFGSVAVILDRPFEVGDWVVVGETEGTVEELGLRSTRIRTFYNSLVTIPNATLVRATVDNYGRRSYRRFKTMVSVTYDTPPEKIEAFCEGIRELVRVHPYTRKDYFHVWLNAFSPASLDVLVYTFHDCPDWGTELRERQRLMLDIIRLARRLEIEFAFPTQTIHVPGLENLGVSREGGESGPAAAARPGPRGAGEGVPGRLDEHRARAAGRRAARELMAKRSWREGERPPPVSFGEDAHLDDLPMVDEEEGTRGPEAGGGGKPTGST